MILQIVGTRFRGAATLEWFNSLFPHHKMQLVREPENPYDPLAIAVHAQDGEEWTHVGYIPKSENSTIAARMDNGEEIPVTFLGGTSLEIPDA